MKRRSRACISARWCTQRLCLEIARQLRGGARACDIAVLLAEAAEAARVTHQLEEVTHG